MCWETTKTLADVLMNDSLLHFFFFLSFMTEEEMEEGGGGGGGRGGGGNFPISRANWPHPTSQVGYPIRFYWREKGHIFQPSIASSSSDYRLLSVNRLIRCSQVDLHSK